ncbi:MAG: hypothetical protein ACRBHB_24740 [Arenicella sp.]
MENMLNLMDEKALINLVLWAPFVVGAIALSMAVSVRYIPKRFRITLLLVLGLFVFFPFEVTRNLVGVEEIGEHLLSFYFLGVAKKISLTVILLHLTILFPSSLSGFFFVSVAVLTLTPFMMPVGHVTATYSLRDVITLCLSMDSLDEIPNWFLQAWQFHIMSFSSTAISSFLVWRIFFCTAENCTILNSKDTPA